MVNSRAMESAEVKGRTTNGPVKGMRYTDRQIELAQTLRPESI